VSVDPSTRASVLRLAAGVFTASAFVAIIAVAVDPEDEVWKLTGSGLSVSIAALLTAPSLLLAERSEAGSGRMLAAFSGIVLVLVGLVLTLALIWNDEANAKGFGIVLAAALALAQANLLVATRRKDRSDGLRLLTDGTVLCGLILAAMAIFAIVTEPDTEEGGRVFAALTILDALGLVLIPIVRRLGPEEPAAAPAPTAVPAAGVPSGRCSWVPPGEFEGAVAAASSSARLIRLEQPGPDGLPAVAVFHAQDGTLSAIVSYPGGRSSRP
jgi:hypothetical protein